MYIVNNCTLSTYAVVVFKNGELNVVVVDDFVHSVVVSQADSASEMTCIVSSGALNSTHSLTHSQADTDVLSHFLRLSVSLRKLECALRYINDNFTIDNSAAVYQYYFTVSLFDDTIFWR